MKETDTSDHHHASHVLSRCQWQEGLHSQGVFHLGGDGLVEGAATFGGSGWARPRANDIAVKRLRCDG